MKNNIGDQNMIYAKAILSEEERKLLQSYLISRQIERGSQESIGRFLDYLDENEIMYDKNQNTDNIIIFNGISCFCSIIGNNPTTPWTIGRKHITNIDISWYVLLRITETEDDFYVYIVKKEGMEKVLKAHENKRRDNGNVNVEHARETFNILAGNTSRDSAAIIERDYVNELETLSCSSAADWIRDHLQ